MRGTRAETFKWHTLVQVEGFQFRPRLNFVILEESEEQTLNNSVLIPVLGVSSIPQSQNDMFQQMQFRTQIVYSDPGETRIGKKLISKNFRNFQLLTFMVNFSYRSINFQNFSASQENQKKIPVFLKSIQKKNDL